MEPGADSGDGIPRSGSTFHGLERHTKLDHDLPSPPPPPRHPPSHTASLGQDQGWGTRRRWWGGEERGGLVLQVGLESSGGQVRMGPCRRRSWRRDRRHAPRAAPAASAAASRRAWGCSAQAQAQVRDTRGCAWAVPVGALGAGSPGTPQNRRRRGAPPAPPAPPTSQAPPRWQQEASGEGWGGCLGRGGRAGPPCGGGQGACAPRRGRASRST